MRVLPRFQPLYKRAIVFSEQLAVPLRRLSSFFLYIVSIYKGAIEKNHTSVSKSTVHHKP